MTALATVDRLAVRLGAPIDPGPDQARAEDALWSAGAQARAIAEHPEWTAESVPEAVADVVIEAAKRIFKNPDRYVANQAGSFQAACRYPPSQPAQSFWPVS